MSGKAAAPAKKKLTHIGQYEIGRTLGEGSFSKVKLATDVFSGKKVSGGLRRPSRATAKRKSKKDFSLNNFFFFFPLLVAVQSLPSKSSTGRSWTTWTTRPSASSARSKS